ncbi:hypothetical protein D3C80_895910 [compost metagenome]
MVQQQFADVQAPGWITTVVVDDHALAEQRGEALPKRGAFGRLAAVIEDVFGAGRLEVLEHRNHRRNADSARDQQVAFGLPGQGEIVARSGDLQQVAGPHIGMQADRSATTVGGLEYADHIAMALIGAVAQGVLANEAAGQVHVDMRACDKWRQLVACGIDKLEGVDAFGLTLDAPDFDC